MYVKIMKLSLIAALLALPAQAEEGCGTTGKNPVQKPAGVKVTKISVFEEYSDQSNQKRTQGPP